MPYHADVDQILETAIAHHTARDLDRAEPLYREVLRADPRNVDALNLLGVILQDRGRAAESIALIAQAIEIDEAFPEAHANLARGLNALNRPAEAFNAVRRALELDPELPDAWLQLGLSHLALGQNAEAIDALRTAAVSFPDAPDLHAALGTAAQRARDHQTAADAWRIVLAAQKDRVEAMVNLGAALANLKQLDEALVLHRRAVAAAPGDAGAMRALATTFHRRREGADLLPLCEALLTADPDNTDVLMIMASALLWIGRFDEARAAYDKVIQLRPDHAEARRQLAALANEAIAQDDIAALRRRLEVPGLSPAERVATGFVLGKALDGAGDHDAAFRAWQTANALRHAELLAANQAFDLNALRDHVRRACATYSHSVLARRMPWANPSKVPVFIVGMPRSSTSLVEQIAASHPLVHGAGESTHLFDMVARLERGEPHTPPERWDTAQVERETARHLARLHAQGVVGHRVIDKTPDNVLYIGQIAVLFPNARIIVCRRDMRDVCVSCYTTHFAEGMNWAYDLAECGARAAQIDRLMDHWRDVLPGRVLEIRYETLVAGLEAESRRLIAFLGLDWDPACLAFHKTERQVTTASFWQVRQPLFDSSVGRWRNYESHLGPLLRALGV